MYSVLRTVEKNARAAAAVAMKGQGIKDGHDRSGVDTSFSVRTTSFILSFTQRSGSGRKHLFRHMGREPKLVGGTALVSALTTPPRCMSDAHVRGEV